MENISKENATAVRLYNEQSEALDDFPVLKAFQQYVDAEQAKARKRITMLSIIFAVVTIILISAFFLIIAGISTKYENRIIEFSDRNQKLNDRLVEFAMKERSKPANSQESQAALNIMKDTISTLQTQISEQQKMISAEQKRNSEIIASQSEMTAKLEADKDEYEKAKKADVEKLRQIKQQIQTEKRKLEEEKEKLRKQAIELQRQRLYPEYYSKKAAEKDVSTQKTNKYSDPELDELLNSSDQSFSPSVKKLQDGTIRYFETSDESATPSRKKEKDGTIRYFQSDDETSVSDSDPIWVIPE